MGSHANDRKEYRPGAVFGPWEPDVHRRGVPGVACDFVRSEVWVLTRSVPGCERLTPAGEVKGRFPLGLGVAHAVCVTATGHLCVVDVGDHVVYEVGQDGAVLRVWGRRGSPSDTGYVEGRSGSVQRSAGPFNKPAGVVSTSAGTVLVADGYGNARVHEFRADELCRSWGVPGAGPGEFQLPHGITVDDVGRIYVADRDNNRLQVFSADGRWLREVNDLARPCDISVPGDGCLYVAELDPEGGRVSVLTSGGTVVSRFPACPDQPQAGAHGIDVDRDGNIIVGLVPRIPAELEYGLMRYAVAG